MNEGEWMNVFYSTIQPFNHSLKLFGSGLPDSLLAGLSGLGVEKINCAGNVEKTVILCLE